jgi:hypothetical protein
MPPKRSSIAYRAATKATYNTKAKKLKKTRSTTRS